MARNDQNMTRVTIGSVLAIVAVVLVLILWNGLFATVENGSYQVRQWPVSGTVDVKFEPGMWARMFGTIRVWPNEQTYFFTRDNEGDEYNPGRRHSDESVKVTFNDASVCHISGTCRIVLPRNNNDGALALAAAYPDIDNVEERLIKPRLRKALVYTANMMSAKESYSDKRTDFIKLAEDQALNGCYVLAAEEREVVDELTGIREKRVFRSIRRDDAGRPLREREADDLAKYGITITNFEVKDFAYSDKVTEQIANQQQMIMAVQTAKAQAERAEQEAKTAEAEGKKNVMEARYTQEKEKIVAVTKAEQEAAVAKIEADKEKQVAVTAGERDKEVAALTLAASEMEKQAAINRGEGEAAARKLVMEADGALEQKLKAFVMVNQAYADALKVRPTPGVVIGGSSEDGGTFSSAEALMRMLMVRTAADLEAQTRVTVTEKQ